MAVVVLPTQDSTDLAIMQHHKAFDSVGTGLLPSLLSSPVGPGILGIFPTMVSAQGLTGGGFLTTYPTQPLEHVGGIFGTLRHLPGNHLRSVVILTKCRIMCWFVTF